MFGSHPKTCFIPQVNTVSWLILGFTTPSQSRGVAPGQAANTANLHLWPQLTQLKTMGEAWGENEGELIGKVEIRRSK